MRFPCAVIDPPWPYPEGFNGFGARRALPYEAMLLEAIAALDVRSVLEREGYLFVWTTNRYLEAAYPIVAGWGCTPRQTIVWAKPEGARQGLGGMFATNVEFCIVAQAIRPGTNAHGRRTRGVRMPSSWFTWPVREHSEKPDEFYAVVEQVARGPYADIFARKQRLGWTALGRAVDGLDIAESLRRAAA